MEEKEIIDKYQVEPKVGQKMIYDHFHVAMTRLCMRYLRDEQKTFEVMTSAFLKIMTKLEQFNYRGEGSLDAWMRKVMVNECLMTLRKSKQERLYVDLDEVDVEVAIEDVDATYVYEAVKDLPDSCRDIFNLHVVEGYSHKEIGEMLDIEESTSRSQLTYAKKKLRGRLGPIIE